MIFYFITKNITEKVYCRQYDKQTQTIHFHCCSLFVLYESFYGLKIKPGIFWRLVLVQRIFLAFASSPRDCFGY